MKGLSLSLILLAVWLPFPRAVASSTIEPTAKFAYSGNTGWIDFRPSTGDGVVFSDSILSGYAYAANFGWITLGDGTPTNGYAYSNTTASDCGVNHDGIGNLSGYAYAANIGWISFSWTTFNDANRPRVNLFTGEFLGYAYAANIGWIALGGTLSTDQMVFIDIDTDGISDAWERQNFGLLTTANATTDDDGDGQSDLQEFIANTNPSKKSSVLAIIDYVEKLPDLDQATIEFTGGPGRIHTVEESINLIKWTTLFTLDPQQGDFSYRNDYGHSPGPKRFFRVAASLPLQP